MLLVFHQSSCDFEGVKCSHKNKGKIAGLFELKSSQSRCELCKSGGKGTKGSGNGDGANALVGENGLASANQRAQMKGLATCHVKGGIKKDESA